jgi:hypothetical protein
VNALAQTAYPGTSAYIDRSLRLRMPARASHLPSHVERRALQELRSRGELSARNLLPTGQQSILKMMAKGWVENGGSAGTYRITPAGEAALRAQLPMRRSK